MIAYDQWVNPHKTPNQQFPFVALCSKLKSFYQLINFMN